MRRDFQKLLHYYMCSDERIYLLTSDLGYGVLDDIKKQYEGIRFFNIGAAEQTMLGIGIGLAQSNKIAICYSITPFLLYRPFEFLRTYINHENIPVKLVGVGRNNDYKHDGFSHFAGDDEEILKSLKNIIIWKPKTLKEFKDKFIDYLYNDRPVYINLSRYDNPK